MFLTIQGKANPSRRDGQTKFKLKEGPLGLEECLNCARRSSILGLVLRGCTVCQALHHEGGP